MQICWKEVAGATLSLDLSTGKSKQAPMWIAEPGRIDWSTDNALRVSSSLEGKDIPGIPWVLLTLSHS